MGTNPVIWLVAITFLMTFAWLEVFASAPPSEVSATPSEFDAYRTECGACHVAYPPPLLPPASWQALMRDLDKHFGVDASLDAATVSSITVFLEQAAAFNSRHVRPTPAVPLRITDTACFDTSTMRSRRRCGSANPSAAPPTARPAKRMPSKAGSVSTACTSRSEE